MKLFGTDLVLLHPPSVYDFREAQAEYGPISDVIFSTPAFEMYPMGFTTIAAHLEANGYNARIVNLAQRMVADATYDVEAAIAKLNPVMFGIDLHWLPHAHGALEIARIVKEYHPETPVVMGGLSATYFHEELIRSPYVDYVMRGDSTEEPMLELMRSVHSGTELASIPNLTWKSEGEARVNQTFSYATRLDNGAVPDIFYVVRSVFKYGSLQDVVPFNNWTKYPITALLTSRGCPMSCLVCGGSSSAYRSLCHRPHTAFRPPGKLVADIKRIAKLSNAPIFLIHDLRHGGHAYARNVLDRLMVRPPSSEIVLELSTPVHDDYLEAVGRAIPRWSLEITLESHIESIRRANKRFSCSNEDIVATIGQALKNGVRRIDVFFMIGLPGQSYDDAVSFDEFCREVLERFDGDPRLEFFAAPLAPFLDPGSEAFEHPDEHGYRVRFRTLEEHRKALTSASWKDMLNYETNWMSRDEIAAASYEAMRRLNLLKHEWGRIDRETLKHSIEMIDRSEDAVFSGRRDAIANQGDETTDGSFVPGRGAAIFQKNYLIWPLMKGRRFGSLASLAMVGLEGLADETRNFFTKRLPLYWALRRPRARTVESISQPEI